MKSPVDQRREEVNRQQSMTELLRRMKVEWQPIETAPKDGTPLLLASRSDVGPNYTAVGVWDCDSAEEGGQCWRDRIFDADQLAPTHWMPLPDPPK